MSDFYITEIFEHDWVAYDWHGVSQATDGKRIFKRGKKKVLPPNDGYHYERCDELNESCYRWERVYERE